MTGDFWVGVVFGAIVGGMFGAIAMAILAAAGAADDRIERMVQDGAASSAGEGPNDK